MTTTNEQDTTTTELITDAQAAFSRTVADLDEYLADDANTMPSAAPVAQAFLYPRLQWGKGVEVIGGRKSMKYTGWLIEIDQEPILDEILGVGGVPLCTVQHMNGNKTVYSQMDSIQGYILALDVPRKFGAATWETGIPYVWNPHHDRNGKLYGSQLECLFFAQALLSVGYPKPLRLSLSRTVTEHFVKKALLPQLGFVDSINDILAKRGKAPLGFYSYALDLVKGEEVSTSGASYYPPVLDLPPLNRAYLETHKALPEHLELIESYLPKLQPWAKQTAIDLAQPRADWTVTAPESTEPSA